MPGVTFEGPKALFGELLLQQLTVMPCYARLPAKLRGSSFIIIIAYFGGDILQLGF